jgi:exodeoxyribonuclease VIII
MAHHIMIDCETLDTSPFCVLLTIGAVIFDPKGTGIIDKIDLRPTMEDQLDLGRVINDDTVRWWGNQSAAAQEEALGDRDRIPFKEAMEKLYQFCWNRGYVWSHGAAFDVVAMETSWASLGMSEPWLFHTVRDTRTLFDVTGVSLKDDGYVTTHKASEDAARQAFIVQKAYQKLIKAGVTPP